MIFYGDFELRTSVYASNFRPIALKLRQNTFQTICKNRFFEKKLTKNIFRSKIFGFLYFLLDFGGAGRSWTSKSASLNNFASDTPFLRSVRPKIGVSSSSNTRNVLLRTQGTLFLRTQGKLFLRTLGMSFFKDKECPSSNTRNVFLRTQGMSLFEHKECLSSNTALGAVRQWVNDALMAR